jgi:ribosome-interacting GTPase 1
MTTSADTLALHPEILFRTVDDEGVVVDQRQPEVMVVNGQAVHILELIRTTGSRRAVLNELVEQYDADEATIATDLDAFLEELKQRKMLNE